MDTASVEEGFSLNGGQGAVSGAFSWDDEFREMTFTPDDLLARGVSYTYRLENSAHALAFWALQMTNIREFFVMAIIIGCVQGGVQGLSRSLFASLIPPEQPGEFFGFYNMTTKFAHVLGPAMVAIAAMLSDDPKWILLALMPLFCAGAFLLTFVREEPVSG